MAWESWFKAESKSKDVTAELSEVKAYENDSGSRNENAVFGKFLLK